MLLRKKNEIRYIVPESLMNISQSSHTTFNLNLYNLDRYEDTCVNRTKQYRYTSIFL